MECRAGEALSRRTLLEYAEVLEVGASLVIPGQDPTVQRVQVVREGHLSDTEEGDLAPIGHVQHESDLVAVHVHDHGDPITAVRDDIRRVSAVRVLRRVVGVQDGAGPISVGVLAVALVHVDVGRSRPVLVSRDRVAPDHVDRRLS